MRRICIIQRIYVNHDIRTDLYVLLFSLLFIAGGLFLWLLFFIIQIAAFRNPLQGRTFLTVFIYPDFPESILHFRLEVSGKPESLLSFHLKISGISERSKPFDLLISETSESPKPFGLKVSENPKVPNHSVRRFRKTRKAQTIQFGGFGISERHKLFGLEASETPGAFHRSNEIINP